MTDDDQAAAERHALDQLVRLAFGYVDTLARARRIPEEQARRAVLEALREREEAR